MNNTPDSLTPLSKITDSAKTKFVPHRLVRFGDIQTLLARQKPNSTLCARYEQPLLLDAGPDVTHADPNGYVRLLAYYTPALTELRRGVVLTLHGWEGCSHSNYNIRMANQLIQAGFDVVRLNMRDHGPNLHVNRYALNRGLFLGTLLDEAVNAVQQVARLARDVPFYIVGVSMGGNFALRLASHHRHHPFPNLVKVIAVNPAVDPAHATDAIDQHPLYRRYFRQRWLGSLLAKEQLYPDYFAFSYLQPLTTVRTITDSLVQKYGYRYGGFKTADEYFAAYTVRREDLTGLTVPTLIISAADDPIISAADLEQLGPQPLLELHLHPSGGHVGFVDIFPLQHRLPEMVMAALGIEAEPIARL
ncbi:MAG: alpha/beta fold hydrolase [Caldilineaceae bacterium]